MLVFGSCQGLDTLLLLCALLPVCLRVHESCNFLSGRCKLEVDLVNIEVWVVKTGELMHSYSSSMIQACYQALQSSAFSGTCGQRSDL